MRFGVPSPHLFWVFVWWNFMLCGNFHQNVSHHNNVMSWKCMSLLKHACSGIFWLAEFRICANVAHKSDQQQQPDLQQRWLHLSITCHQMSKWADLLHDQKLALWLTNTLPCCGLSRGQRTELTYSYSTQQVQVAFRKLCKSQSWGT